MATLIYKRTKEKHSPASSTGSGHPECVDVIIGEVLGMALEKNREKACPRGIGVGGWYPRPRGTADRVTRETAI